MIMTSQQLQFFDIFGFLKFQGIFSEEIQQITDEFENVRSKTSKYINAESADNIVFTKSATEAINLVASCFSEKFLEKGDEVLLSYLEHHANIVPWQIAAEKKGFKIVVINISKEGKLDYDDMINKINSKTK